MAWNGTERVYSNPEWRKTLLATPSGFALFDVSPDALKETNDIWLYFKDVDTAKSALFALGFVKFDDKEFAWDGETRPSQNLIKLIRRFCTDKECLFVESADLKETVTKKLGVKCSYDDNVDDEVIWGIKNVLHGFIPEEKYKITREYRLPLSKGLQRCLNDYLIQVKDKMFHTDFISDVGLLRYLDISLERVPRILREQFDEHVCKIGERIENDLKYAKVVAKILVPELSPTFDFNEMFPTELVLKIQEADECATQYRNDKLSMNDRELIMGCLSHLLVIPKQRDDIMIRVKLTEAQLRQTDVNILNDEYEFDIFMRKHYSKLKHVTFRRVLLETPSGFAIFGVHERVFASPKLIWADLSNTKEANEVVLALGFVKIDDKSIARNRSDGPGPELSRIIQKLCPHENTLIVQDDTLKSIIEEKLEVECYTKCLNDDDGSVGDLMWGLKYFLHYFIREERNYLTENYYDPMSKGLLKALRAYDIALPGPVDRNVVHILGCLEHLTHASKLVRVMFRWSFDQYVPLIGGLIQDDEIYTKVVAQILVPECGHKFDYKSLPGDVAEKVSDVERSFKESGKSVSFHNGLAILLVLDFYKTLNEKRQACLQFLKSGGSEEEFLILDDKLSSDDENDIKLNEWLILQEATLSDKSILDDLERVPDQLRDEVQFGVKGTEGGNNVVQKVTKTIGETDSSKEKSVQGVEFGLSCQYNLQTEIGGHISTSVEEGSSDKNLNVIHNEEFSSDETESNQQSKLNDSSEKVSNVEELVESFIEKSVGTDDNLLKLDHPTIFGGADNVDGQHYPTTKHPCDSSAVLQVVEDSTEGYFVSCSNVPIEVTSEASKTDNDDTLTTVGTQYSEHVEDGDPSNAAVGSEQLLEASIFPPVPEDGARLSSEVYEYQIQINATGGVTSEQTNVVVSQQNVDAVTEEDDITNTLGKRKPSENKAMQGNEFGLSCQDQQQLEIGDSNSTVPGEDAFGKNLNGIHNKKILSSETDFNQHSKPVLTDTSIDKDEILGTEGHLKTAGDVKPQLQPDSIDLVTSKGADNVDEQHHPIAEDDMEAISSAEEDMEAISSAVGSAVGSKVVSIGNATNTTERECSSAVGVDDNMQKNDTSGTVVPSHVDIVVLSTSSTSYQINTFGSTNEIEEKKQDEIDTKTDHQIDGAYCKEFNAPATDTAGNISNGTNMMTGSIDEMILEHSTDDVHRTMTVPTTGKVQDRKGKDEETNAVPTSHKVNAARATDNVDEKKNWEPIVDPTFHTGTVCSIGDLEDKKQSKATAEDQVTYAETKRNAEDTTDPASNEIEVVQNTDVLVQERTEDTISEITDGTKGADQNDVATGRKVMSLKELLDKELLDNENWKKKNENVKNNNKASIKNIVLSLRSLSWRVLSFRRSSKDNMSPVNKASHSGALKSKRRKMLSM